MPGREPQSAMPGPVSAIEASQQRPAGQSEYLLSTPVSIVALLKWLMSSRQPRTGKWGNVPGVVSYPDDLLRFQVRRLAIS